MEAEPEASEVSAQIASIKAILEQLVESTACDPLEKASCQAAIAALSIITVKNNPPKKWR